MCAGVTPYSSPLTISARSSKRPEAVCEMALAAATPATPQRRPMTKNRLSTMFKMPAAVRYCSGFLVLPAALNMALPKLNSAAPGIPKRYTRIYKTAPGKSSGFVPSRRRKSGEKPWPRASANTPSARLSTSEVWVVSCRSFQSCAPR